MKYSQIFRCIYLSLFFLNPFYVLGDYYQPERLAFLPLCQKHFFDKKNIAAKTWWETCNRESIYEIQKFLELIPKPYTADCYECTCGGVRINRYNGIVLPLPTAYALKEVEKIHQHIKWKTVQDCPHAGPGHCEDLCWDGGYFRRLNHKYFPFFKHFLNYCHHNPACECYWHELSERAVEINDQVYKLLKALADKQLLQSEFSDYWLSNQIVLEASGKTFGKPYFPNSHGMASSLTTYTFFYSQYRQMLLDVAQFIDYNAVLGPDSSAALDSIYGALDDLRKCFLRIYRYCLEEHPHPKIVYERGMLLLHSGKPEAALKDIQYLIEASKHESFKDQHILNSEIYSQEGKAYADLGMYDQAIASLTKAIELDPKNKNAFYRRAEAYLEKGNFDKALDDFLVSGMKRNKPGKSSKISFEFEKAFFYHLVEGAYDSALEFIPMMAQSVYGISQILWTNVAHPIESYDVFMVSAYQVGQHIAKSYNNFDWGKFEGECIEEFKEFCDKFASLNEAEKGKALGYMIGKYGIDIFASGAALKNIEMFAQLKEANRLCILQTAAISKANKDALAAKALAHNLERQKFFKNVKIHWDKQNKHVPGKHNYEEGRSIFLHENGQFLVDKYAGTGTPVINRTVGLHDYREIINFNEFIGHHIDPKTGAKTTTTWGEIRYSKSGVHIIPVLPKK